MAIRLVVPMAAIAMAATPSATATPEATSDPSSSATPTTDPSASPTETMQPSASPTPEESVSPKQSMESALRALGLPTGPVDGKIDARTRRALCAYRDLTGVKATRALPSAELIRRIEATTELPRLPRALRKAKALVSLTCQTTYVTDLDRHVLRVLPVSTGKDRGFHATRTGFKRVYWKYNDWQASTLFPEPDGRPGLYRPIYFDRGIAFHGVRKPIRAFPQSHGCVRTWPKHQDWLYPRLKVRDQVFVYGDYWRGKSPALGGYGPKTVTYPPGYVPAD